MRTTFVLDITTDPSACRAVLRLSVAGALSCPVHQVDLAQHPVAFWHGLFDTGRHIRSLAGITAPSVRIAELGRFLGEHVIGSEIARVLAAGVDGRTLLVRLPVDPEDRLAAAFARVPWQIARAPGDDRSLMNHRVLVRTAFGGAEPGRESSISLGSREPLRVLLIFAEAPGQRPLAARLERERLLDLFFEEVMPARDVEIDVLCHEVTRRRIEAQVRARGGYHLVHWSGHRRVNALEIARDEREESSLLTGDELVRLIERAGGLVPSVVFLGGCHSSSVVTGNGLGSSRVRPEEDSGVGHALEPTLDDVLEEQPGFTGTALALMRAGVTQVVATRYEVGDTYARRLARRFYKRMLRGPEHPTVDLALALAQAELATDNIRPGEYDAVDHASALVLGDPPLQLRPNARRSAQIYRRAPKPQPLLPHGRKDLDPPRWFVGRDEHLAEFARRWLPPVRPYRSESEQPTIVGIALDSVDGGTGRMDSNGGALDQHGNPVTVRVQRVGNLLVDGEVALQNAQYICDTAQRLGLVLPEGQILFRAGQVFFEEGDPAEVRLHLLWRETHDDPHWRPWIRTSTRNGTESEHGPLFILHGDDFPERLTLEEADRERCHITAVAAGSAGKVAILFDLRDNAKLADERLQHHRGHRSEPDNSTNLLFETAPLDLTSKTHAHRNVATSQEVATVAVIQGPAGAGKTWLAAEATHLWFGMFDYTLCSQAKHEPLPLEEFYRHIDQNLLLASELYRHRCQGDSAARIHVAPNSSLSDREHEDVIRNNLIDELARERILLVIDNFDTNLLPGSHPNGHRSQDPAWDRLFEELGNRLQHTGSRVIITSRHKLAALANSRHTLWLHLDPVPLADARLKLEAQWPGWEWLYDISQVAGLTITSAKELAVTDSPGPWAILAEPSETLQQYFDLQPEVLLLCAPVGLQSTDIEHVEKFFSENLRIDPGFALVITADPNLEERLAPALPVNRRYLFVLAEHFRMAPQPQTFLLDILREGLGRRRLFDFRLPAGEWQFFGREKELEALERDILSGNSIGVFGLRKVGKTSLLERLADKLREGRPGAQRGIPVKIDLQTTSYLRRNFDGVVELIGTALDRELSRAQIQLPTCPSHPLERLRTAVTHVEGSMGARVLLILDEYEVLLAGRIPIHDGIELLTWLRGLAQEHRRSFGLVLIGRNQRLLAPARIEGIDNPMYRFLRSVHLAGLVPDDCRHMIQKLGGRLGLRFEPDALDIFVEETGGHPNLARTLGDLVDVQIPTIARIPAFIDASLVRRLLPRFSRAVDEDMRELVNAANDFDPRAGDYLVHLAHGVPWIGGVPEARIDDALVAYGILHPEAHAFRIGRLLAWLRENYVSPAQVAHG